MKLVKFCKMMKPLGYEVFLYSGEENEADCAVHVPVVSKRQQRKWFGDPDLQQFYPITWGANDPHWREMNKRAIQEIKMRRESQRDLVLLIAGNCQQQIAEGLPDMLCAEWGVGYDGIFANYCAFESFSWRHTVYAKRGWNDGRWYDATIPNFFDADEFIDPAVYLGAPRADYLLFMGRVIQRKGPHVAAQIADRVGLPLIVAGQGGRVENGVLRSDEIVVPGKHVEYVGAVDGPTRARLMSRAKAMIVPTLYVEPFGGVAVEAMMSGTPVIATDWGAFTETVEHGVTGERFHTLGEGAAAVERVAALDNSAIRARAIERYGLGAVGPQFDIWFKRLLSLWGDGWYED